MQKIICLFVLFIAAMLCHAQHATVTQQMSKATLYFTYPKPARAGTQTELKLQVKTSQPAEWTSYVTLTIKDAESGAAADGIFGNVFPSQYFTTSLHHSATLSFPVSIPSAYNKPVLLMLTLPQISIADTLKVKLVIK